MKLEIMSNDSLTLSELRTEDVIADGEECELTIVMPCLNEAETLATCIAKAQDFLKRDGIRGEVVVADNRSNDGSQEIARQNGARVVDVPVRGYGAALYQGSVQSRGRYIIMGDADDSYDFSDLSEFVRRLREGDDLVMGNRFLGGIKAGAMPWKNRWLGNPALSTVGRLFFQCPVGDFHCGLRGLTVDAFRRLDLRTTGMEYASEMVIKATFLRMRIGEVPTTLSPDGRSRAPHLRPWRDGWRHLRFMLLYSPRWLFLYPGLLLVMVGTLIGAWLLPSPRTVGPLVLDVHTLLYAAVSVLVGFQAVAFAVLSRTFAMSAGLLPRSPRLERFLSMVTMEAGMITGTLLALMGVVGAGVALFTWQRAGFGPLEPSHTLRIAIPSALAIALGAEIVLSSLFLGILRLPLRTRIS